MSMGTQFAAEFYATPRGVTAARLLRDRLALMWPDLAGQSVLGIGYAAPYLSLWRDSAFRCVAASPGCDRDADAARWPVDGRNLACTIEGDRLPFPDLAFDRIVLVHGLEAADNARRMLREAWRVLRDDGRMLIVVPNRVGLWAHVESTPFGQGQPYSKGQIGRLLGGCLFRIERLDTALYVPPTRLRIALRGGALWDKVGRQVAPSFAGVMIAEAVKNCFGAVPLRGLARGRRVLIEARQGRMVGAAAARSGTSDPDREM